jgi:molybdopterin converting factor small subunit
MTVNVKLFATLAQKLAHAFPDQSPEGLKAGIPIALEIPEGSRVSDLLSQLPMKKEWVLLVFVNGRARKLDHQLADGDDIGIFPPIGGG